MKKIIILVLTVVSLLGCKQITPETDYTLLTIQATNSTNSVLELYSLSTKDKVMDLKLDENGFVKDTLRGLEKGEYIYGNGRISPMIYIYVKNNSEVAITYNDTIISEPPTIKGKNCAETKFLNKDNHITAKFLKANQGFWNFKPSKFIETFQQFKDDRFVNLDAYKDEISSEFYKTKAGDIKYQVFQAMGNYESAYKEELPEAFIKKKQEANINDEFLYKNSSAFKLYTYNYLAYSGNALNKIDKSTAPLKLMDKINKEVTNEYVKSGLLAEALEMHIITFDDKKALYNKFLQYCTNNKFKEKTAVFYIDVMKLEPGSPSPKFVNYESANGEKVSLDDLKGKYVFFDCWATWSCITEIPFLKEIEKEYHGKNIVFVGLSFDKLKDKGKWKAMVKEKGLDAEHQLLADNALKSQFTQDYKIATIPRFILLDPEGNIVSSDAPSPSQPELKKLLNSLDL